VYFVVVGSQAEAQAMCLAERWRDAVPQLKLETNCGGGSFKSQMKRADKSGARYALILGESEAQSSTVGLKSLREDGSQRAVSWHDVPAELTQLLGYR
jgi:histidyl-tRNA synthetase